MLDKNIFNEIIVNIKDIIVKSRTDLAKEVNTKLLLS